MVEAIGAATASSRGHDNRRLVSDRERDVAGRGGEHAERHEAVGAVEANELNDPGACADVHGGQRGVGQPER